MTPLHLSASEWIAQFRRGTAATVEGQHHVVAQLVRTGERAYVAVDDADARCAWVDGQLDADDQARVLIAFRGQPTNNTPPLCCVRVADFCNETPYVCDESSGMVYLLD